MNNIAPPSAATFDNERLTRSQKEASDFKWYKEKIDFYTGQASASKNGYGNISEYKRMKVNYDLFNNIIDLNDFSYVCKPFGAEQGELPAQMVNRDISSYRLKAMIGMEMRRPFGYKVMATNKEATNRKEQAESSKIREWVIAQIMAPIEQEAELKYQEQLKGKLSPQEKQEILSQIQAEIKSKTPPEVRKYMQRDHQDPSEVQGQQIINYLMYEQDICRKFNTGWKHALISAYEIFWLGIVKGRPRLKVVNPMRFACDKSSDTQYIEDGEWAMAEFRMSPSEIAQTFELDPAELDKIYKNCSAQADQAFEDVFFDWNLDENEVHERLNNEDRGTLPVRHAVFKSLRKIGWLDYIDKDGQLQTKFLVDENYKLNKANGDIRIKWEWVPEIYEGYKIGSDIYKGMQPVEGQFKDMKNIYSSKLPYYGAIYDNTNSQPTSPMDRMKVYQYYYNIVMFRLELLLSSDKGKKILMNINAIPSDSGIDIEKWQYFFESTPFAWYNPDEEGMTSSDVNTIAKVLDMSLASDINRYIELAEYLEQKCGKSVGVTDPVLGQTAVSERVGNNQQNLVQTSHMLEPYFDLHNSIKKNVLQGMLDLSKVAFADSDGEMLSYVLDDMSSHMFKLDINDLLSSTLGLFMEDSSMSEEIKQTIHTLAHAAMQNQKIELSDVLKVIKENSIQEAEESLLAGEQIRYEKDQAAAQAEQKFKAEEEQKKRDHEKEVWSEQRAQIILKEEEKRKTAVVTGSLTGASFNPDMDKDDDGMNDFIEIARDGVNAKIAMSKEARENRALDHKIADDQEKNTIKKAEIKQKSVAKSTA